MALIDSERDDEAVLAAEDEAIANAGKDEPDGALLPDVARLIEDLSHGRTPPPVQQG